MAEYFANVAKAACSPPLETLNQVCDQIKKTQKIGSKIIIAGNGGSAAIASHLAVDFTKAARIRAVNFNEPDLITCFANDYGYENWIKEALIAYCDRADLVLLISSSGRSPNMLAAAEWANEQNITLVTATGFEYNNPLRSMGMFNIWVDSLSYNVVEMVHLIWLLGMVEKISGDAN
jgi:D-sedoheptulose 7-phosphate isomerase